MDRLRSRFSHYLLSCCWMSNSHTRICNINETAQETEELETCWACNIAYKFTHRNGPISQTVPCPLFSFLKMFFFFLNFWRNFLWEKTIDGVQYIQKDKQIHYSYILTVHKYFKREKNQTINARAGSRLEIWPIYALTIYKLSLAPKGKNLYMIKIDKKWKYEWMNEWMNE